MFDGGFSLGLESSKNGVKVARLFGIDRGVGGRFTTVEKGLAAPRGFVDEFLDGRWGVGVLFLPQRQGSGNGMVELFPGRARFRDLFEGLLESGRSVRVMDTVLEASEPAKEAESNDG